MKHLKPIFKLHWMAATFLALTAGAASAGTPGAEAASTQSPTGKYATVGNYPVTDCVKDTTTGLTWEGKLPKGGGIRSYTLSYTNYDSAEKMQFFDNKSLPRKPTTAEVNDSGNSMGYAKAVNAAGLCGFNDWRLPTQKELLTLVKDNNSPSIDTTWFPNTAKYGYWTSTPDPQYVQFGLHVNFEDGKGDSLVRTEYLLVRLVR